MSWKKTIPSQDPHYQATLVGTPTEWQAKLDDIRKRNHKIVEEREQPFEARYGRAGNVKRYWAKVRIPSDATS